VLTDGGERLDFDNLAEMIGKYREMLTRERDVAFQMQFNQFLLDSAGITDEEVRQDMSQRLQALLESIESQDLEPHQVLVQFFESQIVQDMILSRGSARERELRQLTYEFGNFLMDAVYDSRSDDDFLRHLLTNSLHQISEILNPRDIRRKGESMVDVWVRAMEEHVFQQGKS